eukprot:TRINITY_DN139_c0_g1_i3.p1 TRINITY_DN139_c0_g1~~TRINITY_DN139_c0_g1_i3.p1  ORF type:complete len:464 (+),score=36.50 TRINITY_DN139_c0_g1_i3:423-1814(+)
MRTWSLLRYILPWYAPGCTYTIIILYYIMSHLLIPQKVHVHRYYHIHRLMCSCVPHPLPWPMSPQHCPSRSQHAPTDFLDILQTLWWKLDRALTLPDVELSTSVSLVSAIKAGTTTIIDHHSSPNCIAGSLDRCEDALRAAGLKGVLCYEVSDRDGEERTQQGIEENIRYIEKCYGYQAGAGAGAEGRNRDMGAMFGLHASFTLSRATLQLCAQRVAAVSSALGREIGFHIHVGEGSADRSENAKKGQPSPIHLLHQMNILQPRTVLVHCVDVSAEELAVVGSAPVLVAHAPTSNMNNGVGTAPVKATLNHNIPVLLGTDGITYNMIQESKFAFFAHKEECQRQHREEEPPPPHALSAEEVMAMLSENGKLASSYLPRDVGTLIPGSSADIIVLDYDPPTSFTDGNFAWHMMFGLDPGACMTTIVNGRVLMLNRQVLSLEPRPILRAARQASPAIWERVKNMP